MSVVLIRTFIIYFLVVLAVRLMGKRQIGQLQPTELVVTIILSEIAAIPLEDSGKPLLHSVAAVILLASLEIISSYIALKSGKFRRAVEGNAVYIIKEGKLDIKAVKDIRFTIDDIMEALRQKDVFDISDVEYAIVETNGNLSVMLKSDKIPVSLSTFGKKSSEKGIPAVVVSDGKYIYSNFYLCRTSKSEIDKILSRENLTAENVMLMTLDKKKNKVVIPKGE
ncbi:MAG: DUF421 domain-containing protein [Clostridia bacterium]|nr:DUF421 domain-containing protein [Clostridia bacterium]